MTSGHGERATPGETLRCVFVHAPADRYVDPLFAGPRFPPLWAFTLASHVPDDGRFRLHLHDTRFAGDEEIPEAEVYLFSGLNQDLPALLEVHAGLARRYPQALFALGGPICASFDREGDLDKLSAFEHLCVGDGEEIVVDLLEAASAGRRPPAVLRAGRRFPMGDALPLYRPFLEQTRDRYYGALVEVSRGCPFLCEFCDVRIAPDNNRAHNKSPELIVQELDFLSRLGIRQFQLVCDNFIGDPRWAEAVVDRILAWESETGFRPSLFSWVTVNFYKLRTLMEKMRRAGFDLLHIGIESFNRNSLLETAKVQNTPGGRRAAGEAGGDGRSTTTLIEAIREIQSRGFVIAAGLIFGFDSDREDCFDLTLEGMLESGLLSGDPSLLTALPGTPLYRRMQLAGRLRPVKRGLGFRYQTNLRYLLPRRVMIDGMLHYLRRFCDGAYQYARLKNFFDTLERGNFIPLPGASYLDFWRFARMAVTNPSVVWEYMQRMLAFSLHPRNLYYAAKGLALVLSRRHIRGGFSYYQFWMYIWTNSARKAYRISEADFDVEDVGGPVTPEHVLPPGYEETADEPIPAEAIKAQLRYTRSALLPIVEDLRAG
jgi:radical SAM superfamily enzyme YgiQ (UPF0313 family)